MDDRKIYLEGIQNVRDLGGLQAADGKGVASGRLLRSANLAGATPADRSTLREKWHLAKVIDLRTAMERREQPDALPKDVAYLPIPILDESTAGISHEKSLETDRIATAIPQMEKLYRMMVTLEPCRRNLGQAARCVMEHDFDQGSVLWHCTEGKDRCGLLTAILLSALCVDRRQIMEDYLLTNEVNEAKAQLYYRQMLAAGRPEPEAAAVRCAFLAKESYLSEAFSAIDEQYPDMEAYLSEGLYIPQISIAEFRSKMLTGTMHVTGT